MKIPTITLRVIMGHFCGYAFLMPLVMAALRSGTDPVGKLPEASFHTQLDQQIVCPRCDATYNLICDYQASVGRFFAEESRSLIARLKKAIFMGHGDGHRVSHFETAGVVVISHLRQEAPLLSKLVH